MFIYSPAMLRNKAFFAMTFPDVRVAKTTPGYTRTSTEASERAFRCIAQIPVTVYALNGQSGVV